MVSAKKKRKVQMPGPARAGIGLLIFGAIIVGMGQYMNREALSLYGFIMAASGFGLYMVTSFVVKRRFKT
jgi:hypothetical protein